MLNVLPVVRFEDYTSLQEWKFAATEVSGAEYIDSSDERLKWQSVTPNRIVYHL